MTPRYARGLAVAMLRARQAWQLLTDVAVAWLDDYASSMGAALAYYTLFSLAPFLLIVVSIAGLMFGADAVRGEIFGQLRGVIGSDSALAVERLLASVSEPSQSINAAALGIAFLLIGATSVFAELQNALDRIWQVPSQVRSANLWHLLRVRLLSLGMICVVAFLLMVSLVFGAAMVALGDWWGRYFLGWSQQAQLLNALATFVLTVLLFAFIYKSLPRARVDWRDVWLGATFTAALFTIGKTLIGLYIGNTNVVSGFGAAGSLIVIVIWVYYSAQIFLFGAEFTWVFARTFGSLADAPAATRSPVGNTTETDKHADIRSGVLP